MELSISRRHVFNYYEVNGNLHFRHEQSSPADLLVQFLNHATLKPTQRVGGCVNLAGQMRYPTVCCLTCPSAIFFQLLLATNNVRIFCTVTRRRRYSMATCIATSWLFPDLWDDLNSVVLRWVGNAHSTAPTPSVLNQKEQYCELGHHCGRTVRYASRRYVFLRKSIPPPSVGQIAICCFRR